MHDERSRHVDEAVHHRAPFLVRRVHAGGAQLGEGLAGSPDRDVGSDLPDDAGERSMSLGRGLKGLPQRVLTELVDKRPQIEYRWARVVLELLFRLRKEVLPTRDAHQSVEPVVTHGSSPLRVPRNRPCQHSIGTGPDGHWLKPREAIRVVGDGGQQHLDRDFAIELRIASPLNSPHAAFTECGEDLEGTEARAGRVRQSWRNLIADSKLRGSVLPGRVVFTDLRRETDGWIFNVFESRAPAF